MTTATPTKTQRPETYTDGLGLTLLAHRRYLGLSQPEMADAIGMSLHSYKRIETNRRPCPPGLFDTVIERVIEFDAALDATLEYWETDPPGDTATIAADNTPVQRAALMRACVEYGATTPIIIGEENAD
ncbi:helix-turn-helix DNA binding domain protein [Gordonia phage LittleMunchkin]|nr:helix-turn-helix DNA binding domain protein [Gordonia phage LittleMunchkin]